MRHARPEDLKVISDLLNEVRKINGIRERSCGHFYFKGRGILHFHEDNGKIYADIEEERLLLGNVSSVSDEMMKKCLDLVEKHVSKERNE